MIGINIGDNRDFWRKFVKTSIAFICFGNQTFKSQRCGFLLAKDGEKISIGFGGVRVEREWCSTANLRDGSLRFDGQDGFVDFGETSSGDISGDLLGELGVVEVAQLLGTRHASSSAVGGKASLSV